MGLWNKSEEDGNVSSEYEEDEDTECEEQWHSLVKVDRIRHALCINCVKLLVKYTFLADIFFFGGFS